MLSPLFKPLTDKQKVELENRVSNNEFSIIRELNGNYCCELCGEQKDSYFRIIEYARTVKDRISTRVATTRMFIGNRCYSMLRNPQLQITD